MNYYNLIKTHYDELQKELDRTKWNYEYGIYVAGNYGFPQGGLPGIMMNYDGIVSLSKLLNKLLESGEIKPSVSDEQYQRDVRLRERELSTATRY